MRRVRLFGLIMLGAAFLWGVQCAVADTIPVSFSTSGEFSLSGMSFINSSGIRIAFQGVNNLTLDVPTDGTVPVSLGEFVVNIPGSNGNGPNKDRELILDDSTFALTIIQKYPNGTSDDASFSGNLSGILVAGGSNAGIDFSDDAFITFNSGLFSINYQLNPTQFNLTDSAENSPWRTLVLAQMSDPKVVPEPTSLLLLGSGLIAVALWRKLK